VEALTTVCQQVLKKSKKVKVFRDGAILFPKRKEYGSF